MIEQIIAGSADIMLIAHILDSSVDKITRKLSGSADTDKIETSR